MEPESTTHVCPWALLWGRGGFNAYEFDQVSAVSGSITNFVPDTDGSKCCDRLIPMPKPPLSFSSSSLVSFSPSAVGIPTPGIRFAASPQSQFIALSALHMAQRECLAILGLCHHRPCLESDHDWCSLSYAGIGNESCFRL